MMPRVRDVSRCSSAGARTEPDLRLIFVHRPYRWSISRLQLCSVRSSATVRMIQPPAPGSWGTSLDTISRSLARCSLFSILRETPTLEANGMYTRNRPAKEICAVTRGPLVPIGSLMTWTIFVCPRFSSSAMLGSLRREERPPLSSSAAPFCSPGSSSSSDSIRSEAWRNALFSVPMLTKAAWIPGSTASTVPRWMSPTMRRASGRSTRSSARRSSSRMATRVSRGLPLIRISRFKARSLDAAGPAAAGRPVIGPTRVLSGRGTGRCEEPEQPIGLEYSRSPMHTLNLSGLATYVNNPEISAVPARRHAPCREGLVLAAMLLSGAGTTPAAQTIRYPPARKGDVVDDYHGTKVPDPYRWLEDVDAPETRAWIEAENRVTDAYLAEIGERDGIRRRLTALWNYPRYGPPFKKAGRYFFFKNDGLQNQAVL